MYYPKEEKDRHFILRYLIDNEYFDVITHYKLHYWLATGCCLLLMTGCNYPGALRHTATTQLAG